MHFGQIEKHPFQNFFNDVKAGLFKSTYDVRETQLAFMVKFLTSLSPEQSANLLNSRLVITYKHVHMSKRELLAHVDETYTWMFQKQTKDVKWKIHWQWNNIPTETEWNKWSDFKRFKLEFRKTTLKDYEHIVIISHI